VNQASHSPANTMLILLALAFLHLLPKVAGFGVTQSGNSLVVDTSGGLIFTGKAFASCTVKKLELHYWLVDRTNGDITSMKFNGIEAQDQSGKHSQISSGIGASCSWVQTGNNGNYIKITCTTSTLTQ